MSLKRARDDCDWVIYDKGLQALKKGVEAAKESTAFEIFSLMFDTPALEVMPFQPKALLLLRERADVDGWFSPEVKRGKDKESRLQDSPARLGLLLVAVEQDIQTWKTIPRDTEESVGQHIASVEDGGTEDKLESKLESKLADKDEAERIMRVYLGKTDNDYLAQTRMEECNTFSLQTLLAGALLMNKADKPMDVRLRDAVQEMASAGCFHTQKGRDTLVRVTETARMHPESKSGEKCGLDAFFMSAMAMLEELAKSSFDVIQMPYKDVLDGTIKETFLVTLDSDDVERLIQDVTARH